MCVYEHGLMRGWTPKTSRLLCKTYLYLCKLVRWTRQRRNWIEAHETMHRLSTNLHFQLLHCREQTNTVFKCAEGCLRYVHTARRDLTESRHQACRSIPYTWIDASPGYTGSTSLLMIRANSSSSWYWDRSGTLCRRACIGHTAWPRISRCQVCFRNDLLRLHSTQEHTHTPFADENLCKMLHASDLHDYEM
jgi:hypothetical protein